MSEFRPADSFRSPRFAQLATFMRLPHTRDVAGLDVALLDAQVIPLCVGGDHSLSLPLLRAVVRRHGPVGMVHVDSHQDMWEEYFGNRYFHGTPFRLAVEEGLLDTKRVVQ